MFVNLKIWTCDFISTLRVLDAMWLSYWSTGCSVQESAVFVWWDWTATDCHSVIVRGFYPSWMSICLETHWKFMVIEFYAAFGFTIDVVLDRISLCSSTRLIMTFIDFLSRQDCFEWSINQTGLVIIFTTCSLWKQILLLFFVTLGQEFLWWPCNSTMSSVHSWLWNGRFCIWKIKWIVAMKMWDARYIFFFMT